MDTLNFKAAKRGDRRVKPEEKTYRYLTFEEIEKLSAGESVMVLDSVHKVASVKITSIKKWKTHPNEIKISCKFGLREFFHIFAHRGHVTNEIIVEVEDAG
jgi:hypothetical protein